MLVCFGLDNGATTLDNCWTTAGSVGGNVFVIETSKKELSEYSRLSEACPT